MKSIEEKLAANQLDRLAKHWSGMKGKRIQPTDAIKLSAMVAKFGKDELEQLAAKDIPFLSMAAINNLMIKHNYNATKIKSLMKEDTELLYDLYMFEDVDAGEYDYEGDMAKTQLVTISDAAEELHDMLEDNENMPEWCQNKITKAMDYLDSVRDYMLAKDTGEEPGDENPNESVELDKVKEAQIDEAKLSGPEKSELEDLISDLKIYSDPYSMNPQYKHVKPTLDKIKKKFGDKIYNDLKKAVDSGNWHLPKYGMARGTYASDRLAGKTPTTIKKDGKIDARSAKTTKRSIKYNLKSTRKDPKRLGEEKVDEAATPAMKKAGNELSAYAKKNGGIDKADFMKAADMLTSGKAGMPFIKFVNDQDTEVFEKIITVMSKHMGRQTVEKMFKVRVREELEEKFEPKTAGMKITHKKPHPAGGHYVVLSKPGAGQHVIRHLNKGKVKTLGTVASLGLAKSYIDAKVKGKDPKDLIKKEDVNELNKDTLQKYHKKTQDYMKTALKKDDPKMLKKYGKRLTGSGRANDRLKKMGEATNPLQKRANANKKAIDTGFMKLSKSDYEKEKKRLSGEGAMKRIATTQSNKAERIGSGGSKGLNTFKKKPQNEKLEVSDGMGAWIDDFKQSDAPQFKGKNAKERRDMAIAAYLSAKKDSE